MGRPTTFDEGAFDPNTLPLTIPAFAQGLRLYAPPVVWENLKATRENLHQEQRPEESNLSMVQKTSSC